MAGRAFRYDGCGAKPAQRGPMATNELIRELQALWDESEADCVLEPFGAEALEGVNIDPVSKAILVELGLPESAAPFLSFRAPYDGALPRVSAPSYEGGVEQEGLDHLRIIGSGGDGSPICLDEQRGGAVVLLDHENGFDVVEMSSDVAGLLRALAAYADWHARVVDELGAEWSPESLTEDLVAKGDALLAKADPRAFKPRSFWHAELHGIDDSE